MGYLVQVTQRTRDGGYDLVAEKNNEREEQRLHIECKRYEENIGVAIARGVLGTLNIMNATKAVVVTTAAFTKPARDAARQSKRLELIDIDSFDMEMRHHVSMDWVNHVARYISEMQRYMQKQPGPQTVPP